MYNFLNLSLYDFYFYTVLYCVGGGDRAGSLPRPGPGAWSSLLGAPRGSYPALLEEHDRRS